MPAEELQIGQTLLGRYQIESKIGVGGFGVVYKARQTNTGQPVAIKMLLSANVQGSREAQKEVERFHREMQLIAELNHRSIVSLRDSGEVDGNLVMVLDFVDGRELGDVLDETGPLDGRTTQRVIVQVLEALCVAHERGIVHRDLKPANIMLTGSNRRPDAMVLDFGIAAVARDDDHDWERLTKTGMVLGTAAYMAPEQLKHRVTTPRSDIYAMGLILLECLTGETAVTGDTPVDVAFKHISEPVPIPDVVRSGPFGAVVARATAKNPDDRYASAEEMLLELEAVDPTGAVRPNTGRLPAQAFADTGNLSQDLVSQRGGAVSSGTSSRVRVSGAQSHGDVGLHSAPTTALDVQQPKKTSRLPVVLAIVALLVVGGGVLAVTMGGGDGDAADSPDADDATQATEEPENASTVGPPPGESVEPPEPATGNETTEPSEPEEILALAHEARGDNQHATAEKYYAAVLADDPENTPALEGMGWTRLALGKPTEAIAFFRKALEIDETLAEARFGLALAYSRSDADAKARGEFEAYLQMHPEGPRADEAQTKLSSLDPAVGDAEMADDGAEARRAEDDDDESDERRARRERAKQRERERRERAKQRERERRERERREREHREREQAVQDDDDGGRRASEFD